MTEISMNEKWVIPLIWNLNVVGGGRPKKVQNIKMTTVEKVTELKRLLEAHEFETLCDSKGNVKFPSDEMYQKLSVELDGLGIKMSSKYIYTILLENRYDVKKEFLASHNIDILIEDFSFNDSTINTSNNLIEFRLDVSTIWTLIGPESVAHKCNNYERNVRTLKRNAWTHVLFEEIYNTTKIPCALNFKSPLMTESGIFLKVFATCPECPCEFTGQIPNNPQGEETIFMDCELHNFDSSAKHKKKRQLKGDLRTAVSNKLLRENTLPCNFRRNEAHRLIKFGQEEPPILFSNEIMRKAKTEAFDKALGLPSSNLMENILALKYHEQSQGSIHKIGLDPFFVHYWLNEQVLFYNAFPEKLIYDGSGSIIKSLTLPNGEQSSHVYIYQGCIEANNKTVPVCQMISTTQTTVSILGWMLDFLSSATSGKSSVVNKTKEIVTDFDKALLGASCRAFTEANSLQHYLCWCFEFLTGKTADAPSCLLRLDINHFMNIIAKWNCYPKQHPRVRIMFLRCMAILRKQETLEDFAIVAKNLFYIALCPDFETSSLADEALQFFKEKVREISKTDEMKKLENVSDFESQPEEEIDLIEESELKSSSTYKWTAQIYETCKSQASSEHECEEVNPFYLPQFAVKLKKLLPWFPIFSEIMRSTCGFGTKNPSSAGVESEINDIKNRKFASVRFPLRADKFVAFHLNALNCHLIEIASNHIEITKSGTYAPIECKKRKNSDSEDFNELNAEHNWRNKNKKSKIAVNKDEIDKNVISGKIINEIDPDLPLQNEDSVEDIFQDELHKDKTSIKIEDASDQSFTSFCEVNPVQDLEQRKAGKDANKKNKKKIRYGDPFPQFDPLQKQHLSLAVLQNGNKCKQVHDGSTIYVAKRTCAFDSLCQISSLAILNNEHYKIVTASQGGIFFCARTLIEKGLTADTYKQRVRLLTNVSILHVTTTEHRKSNQKKSTVVKIEGSCNIVSLAQILFGNMPSIEIDGVCPKCKKIRKQNITVLEPNYNALIENDISALQETMETVHLPPLNCCEQQLEKNITFGHHIIINIGLGKPQEIELFKIPNVIECGQQQYTLAGLVAYEGVYKINYVGHYVAYVCAHTKWIEYDDLRKESTGMDKRATVDPQILIYIRNE